MRRKNLKKHFRIPVWLPWFGAVISFVFALPCGSHAMNITLQWDANPVTDEVVGYKVYYRVDRAGELKNGDRQIMHDSAKLRA